MIIKFQLKWQKRKNGDFQNRRYKKQPPSRKDQDLSPDCSGEVPASNSPLARHIAENSQAAQIASSAGRRQVCKNKENKCMALRSSTTFKIIGERLCNWAWFFGHRAFFVKRPSKVKWIRVSRSPTPPWRHWLRGNNGQQRTTANHETYRSLDSVSSWYLVIRASLATLQHWPRSQM